MGKRDDAEAHARAMEKDRRDSEARILAALEETQRAAAEAERQQQRRKKGK